MGKRIILSEIEDFIKTSLPAKLRRDLSTCHIIREADVACCVYHHLRIFLRLDRTWRVFAERHSKITGHIIDIVIFKESLKDSRKKQDARIAIELKWNRNSMPKKDRKSLDKCVKKLHIMKAYFISVLTKRGKKTIRKKNYEKYRLFEIYIRPEMGKQDLKILKLNRNMFKDALSEIR